MTLLKLIPPDAAAPRIYVLIVAGKVSGVWAVPTPWAFLIELAVYWEWILATCPD